MYLFHNIYGDCDHLLDALPDDVTAVPFGWDPVTEQARNDLLAELGQSIPGLPCLLIEEGDSWRTFTFDAADYDGWDTLLVATQAPNVFDVPDELDDLPPEAD